jgi:poly(beta-D-mannuronate) lyase
VTSFAYLRPVPFKFWRLILASVCFGASVQAAEFLVTTPGQITTAMAAAQPGDTVVMTNQVWQNADILFKGNGSATNPITLRAHTAGAVILSGNSRLRIAGKWLVVDGLRFQNGYYSNSDVVQFRESSSSLATNCALVNSAIVDYALPNPTNDNKWVSLYGLSNRVESCFFTGKTNLGATVVVWLISGQTNLSNHHIIRRNYFGSRPVAVDNGGETLRVGDSATSFTRSRTVVEENLFSGCNGEIEIISSKSCDNIYRYNTFDSCQGTLTLRHGNRCSVYGNWFFGHGLPLTGGIRVIGEDHAVFNNYLDGLSGSSARSALTMMAGVVDSPLNGYFQVQHALVAFNTFVGCSNNFLVGQQDGGGTLGPVDCTNANNIVRSSTGPLIKVVTMPTNFLWEGNFFSGATVGLANAGINTTNPLLMLAADGLWRPATNSPVLGAAAGQYATVSDDVDGHPRPSLKDSGCDQASSDIVLHQPLTPGAVGPAWLRAAGPIKWIAVNSNSVTLTWNSLPALTYRVQYSTNLVSWTTIGQPLSNMLTTTSWTDDGSFTGGPPDSVSQRYYRVRLEF